MAHMGPGGGGAEAGAADSCLAALSLWEAYFSLMSEPGTVAAVFEGIKAPSEIILKMAQAGWSGYSHLHKQWLAGLDPESSPSEPCGFENLDQEIFKICTETYEKDFRELLNMPQMTRLTQAGVNRAMDKFGQFQAAMAEFIYLLFLPLKKSLRDMREVLEQGAQPPEDFKDYYRRWLRVLEGHYMTLFKSPECTRTMSHTLNALEDFNQAKEEIVSAALAALPIPTHREMAELYREIYLLKKQVKSLSKKMAALPASG
jgi:polyhydroxyalkanoate synthase subunit PhaE